jgi:ABC-type bacteriocin/lantibiotic exporter with double-glycine peptidase domain
MSIKTSNDSNAGDVVSSETALACLFRLGAQNGVYAEVGAVRRRNLIDRDTLPVPRLVELAGEFGLRAERVRFDWEGLKETPFSHPVLLLLDNKNAVVLVGVRRDGRRRSPFRTRYSGTASRSSWRARIWSAPGKARRS